jgi:hypothetical protein
LVLMSPFWPPRTGSGYIKNQTDRNFKFPGRFA